MTDRRILKRRSTDPVPVDRRVATADRRSHVQGPFELDGAATQRTRVRVRRAVDAPKQVAAPVRK